MTNPRDLIQTRADFETALANDLRERAADLAPRTPFAARLLRYWHPYHARLSELISARVATQGHCILWDAHSIHSTVPGLFDGRLPDLNLGTADGRSCAPALQQRLAGLLAGQTRFSFVVNGRFKGGYITRHYGRPALRQHAVQLEMTQCSYMQEAMPFDYLPEVAARIQPTLGRMLDAMLTYAESQGR